MMDPLTIEYAALGGSLVFFAMFGLLTAADEAGRGTGPLKNLGLSFGMGLTTFASLALGGWILLVLLFGLGITDRCKGLGK